MIAKAVAVGMSNSLSIISSLVDSVVDLVSGVIIWWTTRAIRKSSVYVYPVGESVYPVGESCPSILFVSLICLACR